MPFPRRVCIQSINNLNSYFNIKNDCVKENSHLSVLPWMKVAEFQLLPNLAPSHNPQIKCPITSLSPKVLRNQ